jgi:hypothetical protein
MQEIKNRSIGLLTKVQGVHGPRRVTLLCHPNRRNEDLPRAALIRTA